MTCNVYACCCMCVYTLNKMFINLNQGLTCLKKNNWVKQIWVLLSLCATCKGFSLLPASPEAIFIYTFYSRNASTITIQTEQTCSGAQEQEQSSTNRKAGGSTPWLYTRWARHWTPLNAYWCVYRGMSMCFRRKHSVCNNRSPFFVCV